MKNKFISCLDIGSITKITDYVCSNIPKYKTQPLSFSDTGYMPVVSRYKTKHMLINAGNRETLQGSLAS